MQLLDRLEINLGWEMTTSCSSLEKLLVKETALEERALVEEIAGDGERAGMLTALEVSFTVMMFLCLPFHTLGNGGAGAGTGLVASTASPVV